MLIENSDTFTFPVSNVGLIVKMGEPLAINRGRVAFKIVRNSVTIQGYIFGVAGFSFIGYYMNRLIGSRNEWGYIGAGEKIFFSHG